MSADHSTAELMIANLGARLGQVNLDARPRPPVLARVPHLVPALLLGRVAEAWLVPRTDQSAFEPQTWPAPCPGARHVCGDAKPPF